MDEKDKNSQSSEDLAAKGNISGGDSELQSCKKERDEYLDGWKRAKADFINYKKDEARRIEEAIKFSNEAIIYEMISALDSFHIAISSNKNESEVKALVVILGQLEELLKRFGLEKISISPGDAFDPKTQEAIQEVFSEKPPGVIHEELSKGYSLYGKIIRPARVYVSKGQDNSKK